MLYIIIIIIMMIIKKKMNVPKEPFKITKVKKLDLVENRRVLIRAKTIIIIIKVSLNSRKSNKWNNYVTVPSFSYVIYIHVGLT